MFKLKVNLLKINKYKFLVALSSILITVAVGFLIVKAGSLNPTTTPADTFYTLDDIYHKLDKTAGDPATYGIDSSANPTAPGTMHTLTDIYNKTPDYKTNPGTAVVADVFSGKTFYTFADPVTRKTGTLGLACNTATFDGTANKVTDVYDGSGNGNNRWCMKETGDAVASDICCTAKAWVDGVEVQGTGVQGIQCGCDSGYACYYGSCQLPVIIVNTSGTNKSCNDLCDDNPGRICLDVGTDADATNNAFWTNVVGSCTTNTTNNCAAVTSGTQCQEGVDYKNTKCRCGF